MTAPECLGEYELANYAKPSYSREDVNRAGNILRPFEMVNELIDNERLGWAFDVIDNWRASHSYPLNSFTMTLKNRARNINHDALVAQRIKRLPSIVSKLLDRQDMKLTQMQDIGGCRAALPSLNEVYQLRDLYIKGGLIHELVGAGEKDYIQSPKSTGYRGIHLKYRFSGRSRTRPYDGLKVEIQLRSFLQHKWATAVEAAGTFTKEALKSNRGSPEWLRFFSLMSALFAIREECPIVPGVPSGEDEIKSEIRHLNSTHHIESTFSAYRTILPTLHRTAGAQYYLVILDPSEAKVDVRGFGKFESQAANRAYIEAEKSIGTTSATQVVLVSVSSVAALSRAYPNYFLDTEDFLREVHDIVG